MLVNESVLAECYEPGYIYMNPNGSVLYSWADRDSIVPKPARITYTARVNGNMYEIDEKSIQAYWTERSQADPSRSVGRSSLERSGLGQTHKRQVIHFHGRPDSRIEYARNATLVRTLPNGDEEWKARTLVVTPEGWLCKPSTSGVSNSMGGSGTGQR